MTEDYTSDTEETETPPLSYGSGSSESKRAETGDERRRRELEAAKANRQTVLTLDERVAALEKVAGLDAFKGPDEDAE